MKDSYGRQIDYLRLSLTDRCTLHCAYCRFDEGICPKTNELSSDELIMLTEACVDLGVKRVRLTGGEPTLRRRTAWTRPALAPRITVMPAPAEIADEDLGVACAALNRGVEDCVRLAFAQYQWPYKRWPADAVAAQADSLPD